MPFLSVCCSRFGQVHAGQQAAAEGEGSPTGGAGLPGLSTRDPLLGAAASDPRPLSGAASQLSSAGAASGHALPLSAAGHSRRRGYPGSG